MKLRDFRLRHMLVLLAFVIWAIFFAMAADSDLSQYGLGMGVFAGLISFLSPLILQYVKLQGFPMVALAVGIGLVFALLTLLVGGGLAISWKSAVQVGQLMTQFFGLQQFFFASLKDNLKLDDTTKEVVPITP